MKTLKGLIKLLFTTLFYFAVFVAIYCVCAWLIPKIEHSPEPAIKPAIPLYIRTNGAHTDIILPVKTPQKNWATLVPFRNTLSKDSTLHYIAFGWGDKGFYIETPTWADLTPRVAIKAAFGLGSAAMHTTFYSEPILNDSCKKMMLSIKQYKKLIAFIEESFSYSPSRLPVFISTDAVYGVNDAFYEAEGSYNMFHTCNTWTNRALKACGQKAALWTPTSEGIFQHYR